MKQGQYTVLVVEDEFFILEYVSAHLRDNGFQVAQASDADEAIWAISARPEINIVFTDVRMPGSMDGIQLARWIRENYPDISVIIASGHVGPEVITKDLHDVMVFAKPYKPEAVSCMMRELLNQRRPASDLALTPHEHDHTTTSKT